MRPGDVATWSGWSARVERVNSAGEPTMLLIQAADGCSRFEHAPAAPHKWRLVPRSGDPYEFGLAAGPLDLLDESVEEVCAVAR